MLFPRGVDAGAKLSPRAAEIAVGAGGRGADAGYLEVAAESGETLVTWDRQPLERGDVVAQVERR